MGMHMKMVPTIAMKTFIIVICVSSAFSNIIEKNVNLSLSYHNGFLMLQCGVRNGNCCSRAKKIEFKRNTMGVCNLEGCTGEFAIPQTRDDTENYRCFCPGSDLNRAHLLVTETKSTDDGSWTCECTDKATDKVCKSNTLPVSVASLKEDIAPLPYSTLESKTPVGWIVGFVAVIIGVFFAFLIVARCCLSRRVRVERGNLLTRICVGKGERSSKNEMMSLNERLTQLETDVRGRTNSTDKPEWCICSNCKYRQRHAEQLCCKMRDCITFHKEFEVSCFKDIDKSHSDNAEEQKEKRVKAYKNYNKWGHGIIAAKHRFIILPACCVDKIRKTFPDPNNHYAGIEKEIIFMETPDS